MEYTVSAGWILLLLSDHYRLDDGSIVCRDYQIVCVGRKIAAAELRKSILLGHGEFVDLLIRKKKDEETEFAHLENNQGAISYRHLKVVTAA